MPIDSSTNTQQTPNTKQQDPDCDRLGLVEGSGSSQTGGLPTALNRNRLIAMAAAVVLREHPGTTIVTDSVTSEGLRRFIERRGGRHLRWVGLRIWGLLYL